MKAVVIIIAVIAVASLGMSVANTGVKNVSQHNTKIEKILDEAK